MSGNVYLEYLWKESQTDFESPTDACVIQCEKKNESGGRLKSSRWVLYSQLVFSVEGTPGSARIPPLEEGGVGTGVLLVAFLAVFDGRVMLLFTYETT